MLDRISPFAVAILAAVVGVVFAIVFMEQESDVAVSYNFV